jgi:prepilin-type processing-associated H-X9-DG protein
MVGVGPAWQSQYQVDPNKGLPKIISLGVGIYWQASSALPPNWDATGYPTTVVTAPATSLLLVEQTSGQQCAGNIWTCICNGPASATDELYQIGTNAPPQDPNVGTSQNQGKQLYMAHKNRFNYEFHDGHVETLKIEQTVGSGTIANPKGMWTIAPGD